jgi:protein-S-isoprenylcysteine O-methyltransferase Ste14
VVLGGAGVAAAMAGYRELGSSHDPGIAPTADSELVTTGIYRWTRNPIYLGWMLGGVGVEAAAGSPIGIVVAAGLVVFYDRRVRREERHLVARYGDAYGAYVTRTARFVPTGGFVRRPPWRAVGRRR